MKISIITASYNSAKTIKDTIESIINQTHQDVEYIIIDGGSTDGTVEIVKAYQEKFPIKLISEPDNGLYDAMNKGIKIATGEVVGILNSDDFYKNNSVLEKVAQAFDNDQELDGCYADLEFVAQNDVKKIVRVWRAGDYEEKKLDNGWIIPHPTFFVKRMAYQRYGDFDLKFKIASDYEFLLRLLKVYKIKIKYLPEIFVSMREGGVSTANIKQRKSGWQELRSAWKSNNLKTPRFFITRRVLSKISQYFKK